MSSGGSGKQKMWLGSLQKTFRCSSADWCRYVAGSTSHLFSVTFLKCRVFVWTRCIYRWCRRYRIIDVRNKAVGDSRSAQHHILTLYSLLVTWCINKFNIQQLCTLCPHCMCFVFIWEHTATCATYIINWLVFITEIKSAYCAVRTGSLNKAVCASSLKG